MARPRTTPATPADTTRISVIDRRLKNPFGTPSRDIPLQGEKRTGWVVRTFSVDAEHPNRHYDAVHRLGWVPLTPEDIAVPIEHLGFTKSPDGRVVRGASGHEVLMGMPKADFEAVQKAKSEANSRRIKPAKLRDDLAQATSQAHGDELGEMAYRNFAAKDVEERDHLAEAVGE